jgi:hypothetical protein
MAHPSGSLTCGDAPAVGPRLWTPQPPPESGIETTASIRPARPPSLPRQRSMRPQPRGTKEQGKEGAAGPPQQGGAAGRLGPRGAPAGPRLPSLRAQTHWEPGQVRDLPPGGAWSREGQGLGEWKARTAWASWCPCPCPGRE